MTGRERFLIGGFGGLAPVLILFATGDFQRLSFHALLGTALGYGIRVIALFLIGGGVVSLYRDEEVRIKLFQLGLGAPAMIAGILASSTNTMTVPGDPAATGARACSPWYTHRPPPRTA